MDQGLDNKELVKSNGKRNYDDLTESVPNRCRWKVGVNEFRHDYVILTTCMMAE